jgi:hypothetical protein
MANGMADAVRVAIPQHQVDTANDQEAALGPEAVE